jgi:hypothetical protein
MVMTIFPDGANRPFSSFSTASKKSKSVRFSPRSPPGVILVNVKQRNELSELWTFGE